MLLLQNIMITMVFFTFLKGSSDYFSTSVLARFPPIRYQQLWRVYLIICLYWSFTISNYSLLILFLLFSFYLLTLSFFDADYLQLPDSLTFWLLFLGLIINLTPYGVISSTCSFYGCLVASLIFYSIHLLGYWIYQETILGFGDVKLFSAIGAWCGIELLPYILFFAALLGIIIYMVIWVFTKVKIKQIAFGSCLAFSAIVVLRANTIIMY
ncbi:TPA: prepilin peptidase [Proteus mirabilis]|nr:prepilin peptidase [Proteus mirabilis]HEJ9415113.1 prepilin peptidase [Proteus mirabilis]